MTPSIAAYLRLMDLWNESKEERYKNIAMMIKNQMNVGELEYLFMIAKADK